jgi:probable rRNA maturation factor
VLAREAKQQGKAPPAHWAHLVVHGCLHLLGYDHERPADARRMERRERRVLAGLGFPDPYRSDDLLEGVPGGAPEGGRHG